MRGSIYGVPVRGTRDWLIWFACTGGKSCAEVARLFKISPQRVSQIDRVMRDGITRSFESYLADLISHP